MNLTKQSIINLYKEDILRDLAELVSIKSVTSDRDECTRAMEFIVNRAREMGLRAEMPHPLYCYAEYGDSQDYNAVLTHLDVVPAGDGWNSDPFTLTNRDGFLLGRGVADDKGASIISLYCLKALKESGIVPKTRVRSIFGSAEETGMTDLEAYFENNPLPRKAFTPDSDFPVCNREKGILQLFVTLKDENSDFTQLECGSAVNCVAEKAFVEYNCDEQTKINFSNLLKEKNIVAKVTYSQSGILASFEGVSAHAMEPHKGDNAIYKLIAALKAAECKSKVIELIEKLVAKEGFDLSDEPSGELTICIGLLNKTNNDIKFSVDIRYPVTCSGNEIFAAIEKLCEKYGAKAEIDSHHEPIYFPEDAPLIKLLGEAYKEATGQEAGCYSTGGGTYARTLCGRGVAFGPVFPDSPPARLHMANENLPEEDYFKFAGICFEAVKKLAEDE